MPSSAATIWPEQHWLFYGTKSWPKAMFKRRWRGTNTSHRNEIQAKSNAGQALKEPSTDFECICLSGTSRTIWMHQGKQLAITFTIRVEIEEMLIGLGTENKNWYEVGAFVHVQCDLSRQLNCLYLFWTFQHYITALCDKHKSNWITSYSGENERIDPHPGITRFGESLLRIPCPDLYIVHVCLAKRKVFQ